MKVSGGAESDFASLLLIAPPFSAPVHLSRIRNDDDIQVSCRFV